jgi:hypothetical protein
VKIPFGIERIESSAHKFVFANKTRTFYLSYGGDIYQLSLEIGRLGISLDPKREGRSEIKRGSISQRVEAIIGSRKAR